MFKRGLVIGKFCPLHRGHQALLDAAEGACGQLVIISYTKPAFAGYGAIKRAAWLEALYPKAKHLVVDDAWLEARAGEGVQMRFSAVPHNDAPEREHRAFCAWLLEAFGGGAVDAVFTSEAYGDGFAEALTAYFQALEDRAPRAVHISVDAARAQVPISGTLLRADLYAHRGYMADIVYGSLMQRVALLGGESTGKSTLSKALAEHLKTEYVSEYGRDLWIEKDGKLVFEDYAHIARTQIAWEDAAALKARRYVICDTTPLTTRFYGEAQFGAVSDELIALSERDYDHVFLCEADFGFVQDGWRADVAFQARQQAWYRAELAKAGIPYHVVSGTVDERIGQVMAVLGGAAESLSCEH